MARPTISHGHIYTENCKSKTGWSADGAHESGMEATLTAHADGYFVIAGTMDNVADEYAFYEKDLTNFDTNDYPRYAIRWRTDESSDGVGLNVEAVFTSGTQALLGSNPQFKTIWKVTTGTLTPDKTVDKIRIYADDFPNTIATGTDNVYIQWMLFYAEDFQIPYLTEPLRMPTINREGVLQIPGRVGTPVQNMGMESPLITMKGTMDEGSDWGTGPIGWKLYDINFSKDDVPWRWFTSDLGSFRVHPVSFEIIQIYNDEGAKRGFEMVLRKYDEYDASGLWVGEYYWPTL